MRDIERIARTLFTKAGSTRPQPTHDVDLPWVTLHYHWTERMGLIRGASRITLTCAVCGESAIATTPLPRVGPVPPPECGKRARPWAEFVRNHLHPDRPAQMAWKLPLLNPFASGPLDLDALAMRLDADIAEHGLNTMRCDGSGRIDGGELFGPLPCSGCAACHPTYTTTQSSDSEAKR